MGTGTGHTKKAAEQAAALEAIRSIQLKTVYSRIAKKHGIDFLAASDVAEPSSRDREHMDEESHRRFAEAVYERLAG